MQYPESNRVVIATLRDTNGEVYNLRCQYFSDYESIYGYHFYNCYVMYAGEEHIINPDEVIDWRYEDDDEMS